MDFLSIKNLRQQCRPTHPPGGADPADSARSTEVSGLCVASGAGVLLQSCFNCSRALCAAQCGPPMSITTLLPQLQNGAKQNRYSRACWCHQPGGRAEDFIVHISQTHHRTVLSLVHPSVPLQRIHREAGTLCCPHLSTRQYHRLRSESRRKDPLRQGCGSCTCTASVRRTSSHRSRHIWAGAPPPFAHCIESGLWQGDLRALWTLTALRLPCSVSAIRQPFRADRSGAEATRRRRSGAAMASVQDGAEPADMLGTAKRAAEAAVNVISSCSTCRPPRCSSDGPSQPFSSHLYTACSVMVQTVWALQAGRAASKYGVRVMTHDSDERDPCRSSSTRWTSPG